MDFGRRPRGVWPRPAARPDEIASITGHATLAEVTRYTKAAEQKQLARSAMGRLAAIPNPIRIPKLPEAFGNSAEKPNEINENLEGWRAVQDKSANTYLVEIAL